MRDLIEESVQDYRRAVINRKAGAIHGDLSRLRGITPANYKCAIRGCPDRLLIAMNDDKPQSIVRVRRNLETLNWAYSTRSKGFLCPDHSYLTRQLDHRRSEDGSILPIRN